MTSVLRTIAGFDPMSLIASIRTIWPKADTAATQLVVSAAELKLTITLAQVQCRLPDWGLNTKSLTNFLETDPSVGRVTLPLFPCFFRKSQGGCHVVRKGIALCEDRFPGTSFRARLKAVPSRSPPATDISTTRRWLQKSMSDFTQSGTTDDEVIEAIKLMLPEYERLGKQDIVLSLWEQIATKSPEDKDFGQWVDQKYYASKGELVKITPG